MDRRPQNVIVAPRRCFPSLWPWWLVAVFSFVRAQAAKADEPASHQVAPQPVTSQASSESGYGKSDQKLPEAGQNPVSGLDSLTVGFTFDGGVGSFDRTAIGVHLQPIVPIGLTKQVALVAILDLPVVKGIPDFDNGSGTHWGFGDAEPQFFFPVNIGDLFVGPGVDLLFPTATNAFIGAGKWQLGPGLIFVWVHKFIVAGLTLTQSFSVGGDDSRPNIWKFSLQPTVFVNLPKGTFLMSSPLIAHDWKLSDTWTVPVGAGLGKLVKLGQQNLNINMQGYWNAIAPSIGPKWTVLFQVQLLFPEKGAVVPD
jgi:hypothetical protein